VKKRAIFVLSVSLVLCLLLTTFSSAQASVLHDDPVVTVITGGTALTTTTIALEKLPGSYLGSDGLTLPVGGNPGEKQFGGDGILVTGLTGGSASLCFPAPSPRYGWHGVVSQWDGSKWIALATTTSESEEGINAKACATIYYDGTYALIMSYSTPANQAMSRCPNIDFIYPYYDEYRSETRDGWIITGGVVFPALPVGTSVTYRLLNIDPNNLTGSLSASGVVVDNVQVGPDEYYSEVEFPEGTAIYFPVENSWWDYTFTIRFVTTGCYVDFQYPSDLQ
jgi:hypothetical protein